MQPGVQTPGPTSTELPLPRPSNHDPEISNFSANDPTVPGLFIDTKFQINSKHSDVQAFVDSGNTFHNCISENTCMKLGIQLNDLKPSLHPRVRQAGGGATLQVLGQLPDHAGANGFRIQGLKRLFSFENFFVIGDHNFNKHGRWTMENG